MTDFLSRLKETFQVDSHILDIFSCARDDCQPHFALIDEISAYNQLKVLRAFQHNNISDFHLNGSTGYGYGDTGRESLERVFADVFHTEDALVRAQIVSGTHAIAVALLGNLERGDELISATGRPYDTLLQVIGVTKDTAGSLKRAGVKYKEIPLTDGGKIDLNKLLEQISNRTKILFFQRSRGYEWRPSFSIAEIKEAISIVKSRYPYLICLVDNCYGEFVETAEPSDAGADLTAGSLIKNPGGGLALTGGYLAGKKELVNRAAIRLAAPGISRAVGASLNFNRSAFQGLFISPLVVAEALKGAVLGARFFEILGYPVLPDYNSPRTDIIQAICLGSKEKMVSFCRGIQRACPLDSQALPEPELLPGYEDEVVMAGGTFVQGSSLELSADGPIRYPYNIYIQGGLSFAHIQIGLVLAAKEIMEAGGL